MPPQYEKFTFCMPLGRFNSATSPARKRRMWKKKRK
jgi:hypothetical protein